MIAVIDYDAGNIKSVEHALEALGTEVCITRNPEQILNADGVILPGVGAFGDAMGKLENYGLVPVIKDVVSKGIPFLGICLGLQLLFDKSEETPGVEGLGILKGEIVRIPDEPGLKIPHIGWNDLSFPMGKKDTLFENLNDNPYVYFVHSYYLKAEEDIVVATTTYGSTLIHAAVQKDNVFACQFHPEKSSDVGMSILRSFISRVLDR
ncbi:MAG: imidazole glycerol phosphate synthase subunit HisH [Lachnospiraceae bacterium]|nr:imidazole glycerol phosphate synthase subunit HisH [Candidatus Merdinaster equi]